MLHTPCGICQHIRFFLYVDLTGLDRKDNETTFAELSKDYKKWKDTDPYENQACSNLPIDFSQLNLEAATTAEIQNRIRRYERNLIKRKI